MTISEWQEKIHTWARSKGWWKSAEDPKALFPEHANLRLSIENREHRALVAEKLLLVHSEITEAVEEYRSGKPFRLVYGIDSQGMPRDVGIPTDKPEGFPTELADAVIRILDLAEACGIDLEGEIERKMAYNETRAQRHGGKLL